MRDTLWRKMFFQEVYTETARIIGYAGIEPFAFWDAAKALNEKHGRQNVQNAVHELTRYDRREASPPRYELTAEARKWCWGILGPPPGHPEYQAYWASQASPPKREGPPPKQDKPSSPKGGRAKPGRGRKKGAK